MMFRLALASLLASSLVLAATAAAQTTASPPAGFVPLFNGHDLANWQVSSTTSGHWKVEQGELVNDGKGEDLATIKSYRNFELMLEWKIPLRGDSGVYLPGGQQVQIWAKDSGSGGFVFNHKYTVSPSAVADKPLGEWNTYLIKLLDSKVTVTLNGKVVMQEVPVEKGFDPPLLGPVEGPLRLQNSPHKVQTNFRHVFIREL